MSRQILQTEHVLSMQNDLIVALQGQGAAIREEVMRLTASHEDLNKKYRRSLWLSHGCPIGGLYGDDGEMQCANFDRHGVLDFVRMTVLHLEEELGKMHLTESGIIIPGLNDDTPRKGLRIVPESGTD